MINSTSKVIVLCCKKVDCFFWVGNELLPKVMEVKLLSTFFMSEDTIEHETDWRSFSSNLGSVPDHCGEDRAEPEDKTLKFTSLSTFQHLTYACKIWVVAERMRSWI